VKHEASNILRRFIRVAAQLDPTELRHLTRTARTLRPEDLRLLAWEIREVSIRKQEPRVAVVIRAGDPPRPHRHDPVDELRGLAHSIIRYGGPDDVRRDADPLLVDAVNRMGWTP
jgi:hypothetical protein